MTDGSPRFAESLAESIRTAALARGFARVGFTPVEPLARADVLDAWLRAGRHGEMDYMARDAEARARPRALLAEARTLVTVVASYHRPDEPMPPGAGFVARYARGADYHTVLRRHLRELAGEVAALVGRPVASRACVDTAPLLEREAAMRAGVGFVAKNTLLLSPGLGSYTVLGELLLDVEIAPGAPDAPRCGACRRCLDACPTGALVGEWTLDARLCISYLTIELRGPIPRALRPLVGTMIFGCDRCQEVCPFNEHAPRGAMPDLVPLERLAAPRLTDLLALGTAQYRKLVAGTSLRRVRRAQLLRNVAVALGNTEDRSRAVDESTARETIRGELARPPSSGEAGRASPHRALLARPSGRTFDASSPAVSALCRSLETEREPLVRGHVAWALGRIGGGEAVAALERARRREADPFVREEIEAALEAP